MPAHLHNASPCSDHSSEVTLTSEFPAHPDLHCLIAEECIPALLEADSVVALGVNCILPALVAPALQVRLLSVRKIVTRMYHLIACSQGPGQQQHSCKWPGSFLRLSQQHFCKWPSSLLRISQQLFSHAA